MPLPADFSDWEHLQSSIVNVFKKQLREEFKDLGETWEPDIAVPRSSLRVACTPKDNDTAPMLILRILFFYMNLQRIGDIIEPWYGIPVGDYQQDVKFKPQIDLYFREDASDVEDGYQALRMHVTLRLMSESSTSITKAKLTTLATKIKANFCTNHGRKFKKGKELYTYFDPEKGYNLQLYAFSELEAKTLVNQVLDIQSHTLDTKLFVSHVTDNASGRYPIIPPSKTILGEIKKEPRKRPVGYVRFMYATAHVWGKAKPVVLVDRSFRYLDPLVDTES